MTYTSNCTLEDAAGLLQNAPSPIWILTHAKPDGDALGSMIALRETLAALGKTTQAVVVGPVSQELRGMSGLAAVAELDAEPSEQALQDALPGEPGFVVVCDTGAEKQLGPVMPRVSPWMDRTLVLDHHLSGDLQAGHKLIDANRASCAELIADVIQAIPGVVMNPATREALYTGIATDTGWFRYSSTNPGTLRRAADLMAAGVDHATLFERIEHQASPAKLGLIARALASLRYAAAGKAAVMAISRADFEALDAGPAMCDGIVQYPLMVGSVQAVALLTERPQGDGSTVRISFRSKPIDGALNVAEFAGQFFDGGGHARAAGGGSELPLAEAIEAVCRAFDQALSDAR